MKTFKFSLIMIISAFSCAGSIEDTGSILEKYDFNSGNQIELIPKLNEISDLTLSNDGNILAITDEIGVIYKINPLNGEVLERFFLGRWTAEADFEGLANSGKNIYAVSSEGILYKFIEGENEKSVDYEVIKLPFSSKFDIEGLYYDNDLNGLLIVPKEYPGKSFKDYRTVYFYSLKSNTIEREPIIKISLKELKKDFGIKDFFPSGITKHPQSGSYLIISAKGDNVIVEINPAGKILGVQELKEKDHRQPEGITIIDNSIYISDEAAGKEPTITIYKYHD